ncbi:MAG: hypothetical protein IIC07_05710 [Proteobacteria bacterium]|nr:hypothetical protein [Pseudomonadota bacterium]
MIRFVAFLVSAFCFSSAVLAADFTLPEGFRATVFADDLGYARHLAVREDGAVYTILRRRLFGPGLVADDLPEALPAVLRRLAPGTPRQAE